MMGKKLSSIFQERDPIYKDPILSSNPPQYTNGLGSRISNPEAKLLFSSSISNIEGCRRIIASIVLIGDEVLEAYESLLLDIIEPWDAEEERRREDRRLEKERDWKRVVRILVDVDDIVSVWGIGSDGMDDG